MNKVAQLITENLNFRLQPFIAQLYALKEEVKSLKDNLEAISIKNKKERSSKFAVKPKEKSISKTASKASKTKLSNYIEMSNSIVADQKRHRNHDQCENVQDDELCRIKEIKKINRNKTSKNGEVKHNTVYGDIVHNMSRKTIQLK